MTAELRTVLEPAYPDRIITSIDRRPYPYATSFHLDELTVEFESGACDVLILKDFARSNMLPDARRHRPTWLDEPTREIKTYRRVLAPAHLGPRCRATVADVSTPRFWLIVEKAPGVELWQIGDVAVWEHVVRWLAGMHESFADRQHELLTGDAGLPLLHAEWFDRWTERAVAALRGSSHDRAAALCRGLAGLGLADALAAMPTTLIHGEFYSSNVIVGESDRGPTVCPVDWETAAVGPAMIDLAAITSGWDAPTQARLVRAYGALGAERSLLLCRLHLALRWIGWSGQWRAPTEHRHDWVHAAWQLTEELHG